jgi:hypothetical protein
MPEQAPEFQLIPILEGILFKKYHDALGENFTKCTSEDGTGSCKKNARK